MDNPKVVSQTTVGTTLEHRQGRMTLMRFAMAMMLAASLALAGCSGDDEDPGEVVDTDVTITNANQNALAGLTFEGSGSQFGFPQLDIVELDFYINAAGNLVYDMDEVDEDGNLVANVFMGGTVSWDITSSGVPNTGRCTFRDAQGNALDTTVAECTMTVASDGLCSYNRACSGSLTIDADALDDSDDVSILLQSNSTVVVNGVNLGVND